MAHQPTRGIEGESKTTRVVEWRAHPGEAVPPLLAFHTLASRQCHLAVVKGLHTWFTAGDSKAALVGGSSNAHTRLAIGKTHQLSSAKKTNERLSNGCDATGSSVAVLRGCKLVCAERNRQDFSSGRGANGPPRQSSKAR